MTVYGRDPADGTVDVSAVVVTYNSAATVLAAIRSVKAAAEAASYSVEVIVVDNASKDSTVELVRGEMGDGTLLVNDRNEGFGRANNRAFAAARGRMVLLLNPDAELDRDALRLLGLFLATDPRAGLAAPTLVDDGDEAAESAGMAPGLRSILGHFLFLNRIPLVASRGSWAGFQLRTKAVRGPVAVDWVSGAACLVRRAALDEVGGFDPSIFLYGEDIDLCARLRSAGWTVWLAPAAKARHAIAGSQGGVSTRWVDGIHLAYRRNHGRVPARVLDLIVGIGLALRAMVLALRREKGIRRARMVTGAHRAFALARGASLPDGMEGS